MSSVVISGDTSGTVTVAAPAVAGSNTLTLQAATATSSVNTLSTAVASTSGTSIDFTTLPDWIKRITVMFSGVSTNGADAILIQLGDSGGIEATGYIGCGSSITSAGAAGSTAYTTGFGLRKVNSADTRGGAVTISTLGSNAWTAYGVSNPDGSSLDFVAGYKTLSGTLDRVRITTLNGTNTFDAGIINILFEG